MTIQCAQICIKIDETDDKTDRQIADVPKPFILGIPTSNARPYKTK